MKVKIFKLKYKLFSFEFRGKLKMGGVDLLIYSYKICVYI